MSERIESVVESVVESGRLVMQARYAGTKVKTMSESTAESPWTTIARSAYMAYAASTGSKNFQGDPMPAFDDLPEPIRIAWQAAVRQAVDVIDNEAAIGQEQRWAGYTPPSRYRFD